MNDIKTEPASAERDVARRKANGLFAHDERTALVKDMVAKENAATDQKTARLRALRLAKEEADREAGLLTPEIPDKPARRRSPRKIIRG